jgi:hypothetical protein
MELTLMVCSVQPARGEWNLSLNLGFSLFHFVRTYTFKSHIVKTPLINFTIMYNIIIYIPFKNKHTHNKCNGK